MSPSDTAIAPSRIDIQDLIHGFGSVTSWAQATAQQHGLTADPELIDIFADAVSRLSDAEVHLDRVERLLLAIERAGLVNARDGVLLHAAYLRQKP